MAFQSIFPYSGKMIRPLRSVRDDLVDGANGLRRAISLMKILASHTRAGWRLSELAVEAGLPNSTVHRILAQLASQRLVCQVPGTKRYALGVLAFELGLAAAPYFDLGRASAQILNGLVDSTDATVFLNLRSGPDSVCIARRDGSEPLLALTVEVGTRRPLSVSAGGVAILLGLPRAEQLRVQRENLDTIRRHGLARQAAALRMFCSSKKLGYGCNIEEIVSGISAIGVQLCDLHGQPIGSLSIADLADRFKIARRASLLQDLRKAAGAVALVARELRL